MPTVVSPKIYWSLLAAITTGCVVWLYMKQHPEKKYIFREVPVQIQVEKPAVSPPSVDPMIYPELADPQNKIFARQPGPTYPPAPAAQMSLPPVPINPSYENAVQHFDRRPENAQQAGVLTADTSSGRQILPLFAQRSNVNRNRYTYWSRTGDYQPLVVPVNYKGRDCMQDPIGCDILYTGDIVRIPAINPHTDFSVSLYNDLY